MALVKYVEKTLALLEKEREAEIEETRYLHEKLPPKELERKGVCLLKLRVSSHASGLYGRTVVTFEPFWMKKELPPHNMNSGDIVQLSLSQSATGEKEALATGLISKVTPSSIAVAFDESQQLESLDSDQQYKLLKVANDVTYQRLKRTLTNLHKAERGPAAHLVNVLFGEEELYPPEQSRELKFFNPNLNECQKEAVEFALFQKDVAVIHGPPGTGKTTTVVEIIMQAVLQKQKVLACAPSNIAVDNLVERLVCQKQKVVRIGHPSRLLPHLQKYCLDAILTSSSAGKLVIDVKKDMDKACSQLIKCKNRGEKFKYTEEMKFLRKELRHRMSLATKEVLENADVVLVTLTSASNDSALKELKEDHFNLVVIDECSQSIEAACWMPLPRGRKCVLAGDHCQLPPTILSKEAAKEGLEITLMERILNLYGNKIKKMLVTQYRMHYLIMQWSSNTLYNGQLVADSSVEHHLLRDLEGIEDQELTSDPLLLIDTAGCDLWEMDVPEEISKGNTGEADIVNQHVRQLISCGLSIDEIAVIAPYNLQVELLRLRLSADFPKLEIKSVDGFQGREKEAVVISLVRSNKKGEVGFLAENRRINVAITRARRHLAIICDSETVGHNEFLHSLMDYVSDKGQVQTAHQYIQEGVTGKTSSEKMAFFKEVEKHKKQKKSIQKIEEKKSKKSKQFSKKENDEKRQKELHEILKDFAKNSNETTKSFPPSLNSFERMLVHEIAVKLGLSHVSKGDGDERHIVVSKSKGDNSITTDTERLGDAMKELNIEESNHVTEDCSHSNGHISFKVLETASSSLCRKEDTASDSAPVKASPEVNLALLSSCGREDTASDSAPVRASPEVNPASLSSCGREDTAPVTASPEVNPASSSPYGREDTASDGAPVRASPEVNPASLSSCGREDTAPVTSSPEVDPASSSPCGREDTASDSAPVTASPEINIASDSAPVKASPEINIASDSAPVTASPEINIASDSAPVKASPEINIASDSAPVTASPEVNPASSSPCGREDTASAGAPVTASPSSETSSSSRPKQKKYTKNQNKPFNFDTFNSPDEEREKCPHCLRDILKNNFQLHTVHCSRRAAAAQKALLVTQPLTQPSVRAKTKAKKTDKMVNAINNIDADDFDGLINAAMDVNSKCGFGQCKQKTQMLGVDCQFCRLRYCFAHSLPEVHGCGHEAKAHARATLVKEGVVYRGSGLPSKLPNATKKAQLKKKLDKKLTNLADQRKTKPKNS